LVTHPFRCRLIPRPLYRGKSPLRSPCSVFIDFFMKFSFRLLCLIITSSGFGDPRLLPGLRNRSPSLLPSRLSPIEISLLRHFRGGGQLFTGLCLSAPPSKLPPPLFLRLPDPHTLKVDLSSFRAPSHDNSTPPLCWFPFFLRKSLGLFLAVSKFSRVRFDESLPFLFAFFYLGSNTTLPSYTPPTPKNVICSFESTNNGRSITDIRFSTVPWSWRLSRSHSGFYMFSVYVTSFHSSILLF